jgi:hypothetical protein
VLRSVLGVVVSLVATALLVLALSFGYWFAMGVDGVLRPGTYDGTLALNVWSVVFSVVGAVFGGWLCAVTTRSRTAMIVFAALSLLMAAANAVGQVNKPEPGVRPAGKSVFEAIGTRKEPVWFVALVPPLGAACALVVGLRVLRGRAKASV